MNHDMAAPTSGGFLHTLFQWLAGNGYAPHRGCFLGDTHWVTAYVAANWVISLAYTLIALLIFQRMKRASHIPRTLMGNALLGIFVTCSVGHFLEGFTTLLWPGYRLETMWHWMTAIPAWLFLANHNKFSLIVEGPHMIAETREELSNKNVELNTLYEQVKEADKIKSEFFANVSHELRTPLTLILGPVSSVLAADNLTDAQRSDLETVARNARTLLKHVNDLLDLSRMEADRMKMHYAETDLAHLARLAGSHFESVVKERGQTLRVESPDSLIAQADPDKMQRVLLNLFSNAVKFVPSGGTIVCRLRAEGSEVVIEVEDNGPGIPAEKREVVFERFRQVDSSATRAHEGTGLGLAIVKDFLELHGGGVQVTDAPGGGALFYLRLPLCAPHGVEVSVPDTHTEADLAAPASDTTWRNDSEQVAAQIIESLSRREQAEVETQETGQPLVLVVEDNREMSRYITHTLAPLYRTAVAYDGQAGLERALELRPDLILSDIMMPGTSGDQMVTAVRAHPELNDIPIILLTAKADDDLRVRLLRTGAQDYVTKPFAPEELRARVQNLVSIKRARQVLQQEITSQQQSLEGMADEVAARKRALQDALADAQAARQAAETAREQAVALQGLIAQRNGQLVIAVKEAHHRIKNNLQIVSALLELQLSEGSPQLPAKTLYAHLRQIKAISLIHNLLSPDSDFSMVDAGEVLRHLVDLLNRSQDHALPIRLQADFLVVHVKVATSLVLIVSALVEYMQAHSEIIPQKNREPLTPSGVSSVSSVSSVLSQLSSQLSSQPSSQPSSQKSYQEPETANVILIQLRHDSARSLLTVENPGPGFAPDFDVYDTQELGLELVASLVASDLQGRLTFGRAVEEVNGGGYSRGRIEIVFPEQPDAA